MQALTPIKPSNESIGLIIKITVIIGVILAVFLQDFILLFSDALYNQSTSYILAIPFIFIYLIYRKREIVKTTITEKPEKILNFLTGSEIIGALLLAISVILYWYGSYTFSPLEYHILSLPIFTSGCLLIFFNIKTLKELMFPTIFLFLLVPPPTEILYSFGGILSSTSSSIAYSLLSILNFPVTLISERGTPTIFLTLQDGTAASFAVDISCSGVYSLVGFFIFALVMAYAVRGKTHKKIGTFLLGFPLIYALNIIRIFSIVIIGYYAGLSMALSVFHLLGGWVLIFIGSMLILFFSEKVFKIRLFASSKACSTCEIQPLNNGNFCFKCNRLFARKSQKIEKKDMIKIFALIFSTVLILSIQVPVFAITEGPAEIILQNPQGQQMETNILPEIDGYSQAFLYRDFEFENISNQDASIMYAYYPNNRTQKTIWVGIEMASTRSPLHPWEVCLITYWTDQGMEPKASQLYLEDVELLENPPIIGRFFHFQWLDYRANTNPTQAVLYWYETSIFKLNSTSETKTVKISVITYPDETDTNDQLINELGLIAKQIANHWEPIKPWSFTALLLSQNGLSLIGILGAGLITIITYIMFNERKIKQKNQMVYNKLSQEDKKILNSIKHNKKTATVTKIAETFNKNSGKPLENANIIEKLQQMKKIGLVKENIINIEDEPFLVWKTTY